MLGHNKEEDANSVAARDAVLIAETDNREATLISVLRELAARGLKPSRVASRAIPAKFQTEHRIEAPGLQESDDLLDVLRKVEGVADVRFQVVV